METPTGTHAIQHASWGRAHPTPQSLLPLRTETLKTIPDLPAPLLGYGLGRSYGDSCLNSNGLLLSTKPLDFILSFDRATGILRAQAGVTLTTILSLCHTANSDGTYWFLPVTPGTKYVTLAGAVANDVHGKNHEHRGSFGCHVRAFTLHRGDGSVLECSHTENSELFFATIGGMGLTGFISEVELQLMRVPGLGLDVETQRFSHVDQFTQLAAESSKWEYTVAWIDCLAPEKELGRGLFGRARHIAAPAQDYALETRLSVPFTPPICPLNRFTLRAFNMLYLNQIRRTGWVKSSPAYPSYFYPLDAIAGWNKMYGPKGFYQYQCVLPKDGAMDGIRKLLLHIRASGQGSFLAVLKSLGAQSSGGMLSFPREGLTLALDFPNKGEKTLALLAALDDITLAHGGRIYPAKDGRTPPETYHRMMPQLTAFTRHIDHRFTSDFWQRMQSAIQTQEPIS